MAMIYAECLAKAVADGKISQKTSDEFQRHYENARKEAEQQGRGGSGAHTFAMSEAALRMAKAVGEKKEVLFDRIQRTDVLFEEAGKHSHGLERGLQAILGQNIRGGGVQQSVGASIQAVRHTMNAKLGGFLEEIRSKNFGLTRDRAPPLDLVKEAYGIDSGTPSAKVNWEALTKFYDWWGENMKAEKVFIAKLKDYFLPQEFNTLKLRALGKDGFIQAMMERWNDKRLTMRDWQNKDSEALLDPAKPEDVARVQKILDTAYDNIVTNGNASIEPGMPLKTTMQDRYNRRRVFEWRTYEGYLDFLETFGNGRDNLSDAFMRHLNNKAHDLGIARVLGSDPDHMARTLIDYGKKNDIKNPAFLEALWMQASGKANEVTGSRQVAIANTMQGFRNIMSGAQLSQAAVSSLSDFAFVHSTAAFNGLDFTKVMSNYLGGMDRRQAMQLLGIYETGLRGLRDHSNEHMVANVPAGGGRLKAGEKFESASGGFARVTSQMAEFVMRGTGLEFHSAQGRMAYGMAQLARMADDAALTFDRLDPKQRAFLERYGITSDQWDILRSSQKAKGDGEHLYLDPATLAFNGSAPERRAALALMGAIDAETKFAIPEGGIATGAILKGAAPPGTFAGEFVRLLQYKGFAMSVGMMHGWRMIDRFMGGKGFMERGGYMALLAIEATMLGAASYQLKNIINGKNPENMYTPEFWLKAAAVGGAGGMLGDWAKTLIQTQSMDDATRMLPPVIGFGVNLSSSTIGNVVQAIEGKDTHAGREGTNLLRKYAFPRLWYTNLAIDRLVWDNLQRAVDPDATGAFHRIEQRERSLKTGTGTRYWLRPGQMTPEGPPDFSAGFGR